MSDLDRFELFAYVAQTGSLTRAAKQLNVTKASLSKKIKRLEQDFRINLFFRHKQRLQLTTQGEALLEQCIRLNRELEDARLICRQFNQEPQGNLYVVAFDYFAHKLIFPRLKKFLNLYPKISLRIDTTERVPNFMQEQVDLALGFSLPVPNPNEVIQKRMATTRYILCASPQYLKENSKPKNLTDLQQHQYIAHASRAVEQIIKLKPGYDISLKPYLVLNTVASMIECAKQDLGLIQLPLYMLDDYLRQGILVSVLEDYQAVNANIYFHYPKLRYMQPKVRRFIDFFLT